MEDGDPAVNLDAIVEPLEAAALVGERFHCGGCNTWRHVLDSVCLSGRRFTVCAFCWERIA